MPTLELTLCLVQFRLLSDAYHLLLAEVSFKKPLRLPKFNVQYPADEFRDARSLATDDATDLDHDEPSMNANRQ